MAAEILAQDGKIGNVNGTRMRYIELTCF